MKKLSILVTALLILVLFASPVHAGQIVEEQEIVQPAGPSAILQAALPLTEALEEYYTITDISILSTEYIEKADGTAELVCDLEYTMCLKATSVEQLPYVAGMLSEVGVSTMAQCDALAVGSSTQAKVAEAVSEDLACYAEYIGVTSPGVYTIMIRTDANGNVTEVLACGERNVIGQYTTFPLSDCFPDSAQEMFGDGVETVENLQSRLGSAVETASAVSNAKIAPNAAVLPTAYDRLAARGYAMI